VHKNFFTTKNSGKVISYMPTGNECGQNERFLIAIFWFRQCFIFLFGADAVRVRQILTQSTRNAIKFEAKGGTVF